MANLEIQIGADNSEFLKKISETEKELKKLESQKQADVKLGIDTSNLNKSISEAKTKLEDLKKSAASAGQSFGNMSKPVTNAGHTLTQFSRIAQDAPFGIMGIGNNLTATAEAFSNLSKSSGGAGNALKAVAGSLMGGGGILLAISLVTTGLTLMAQKGLTVADVFNKVTGNFNEFKRELSDVNKEAAKNAAEQVQSVKAYTSAAKDINLSMQDRLIAVKKLQDEYPAYFGNLTKEQILSGNVASAVRDVTAAIKAKARAQALSGKLGDLAAKEFELQEKRAEIQDKLNKSTAKTDELLKQIQKNGVVGFNERLNDSWTRAGREAASYADDLKDVSKELDDVTKHIDKLSEKSAAETKMSIKLDFEPPKLKKTKELQTQVSSVVKGLKPVGLDSIIKVDSGIFTSDTGIGKDMDNFINRLRSGYAVVNMDAIKFNNDLRAIMESGLANTFGQLGQSIGEALATGGNVLQAVGSSLIAGLGAVLSQLGDKLIAVGTAAVLAGTVASTFFTPVGIAAGLAAIAGGVALKAGGGFLGSAAKSVGGGSTSGSNISAGNSVSSPTSSVNSSGGGSGWGNVVFEISGQSLVGVLSNTLNKNTKLGGAMPAI